MKIIATIPGDNSVGIWDCDILAEFPDGLLEEQDREDVRGAYRLFIESLVGEKAFIRFSDECPDCGKVDCHRNCMEVSK